MAQEIGESREVWGRDVMQMAENFAKNTKSDKPFYIVYAAKYDPNASKDAGRGAFRQTFKAYHQRPPKILGVLVWFVNHSLGQFDFVPELSSPPDLPLDPSLLSDRSEDQSVRVMNQAQDVGVLLS